MPNWVYSGVSITGDAARVQEVKNRLAQPFDRLTSRYVDREFVQTVETIEPTFSFWNIVRPEGEDRIKYDESLGASGAMPYWYDWNCENWGTKWDSDGELEEYAEDHIHYRIETAWSPPVAALVALSAQYPDLHVEMDWEEEQGFGGTIVFTEGTFTETESYDIPNSHADYVERGKDDQCVCAWADDVDNFFSDCPRPEGHAEITISPDELEIEAMT